jgi:hypothetical protein
MGSTPKGSASTHTVLHALLYISYHGTHCKGDSSLSRRRVLAHCGGFGTFGREVWVAGTTRTPGAYRTTLRA